MSQDAAYLKCGILSLLERPVNLIMIAMKRIQKTFASLAMVAFFIGIGPVPVGAIGILPSDVLNICDTKDPVAFQKSDVKKALDSKIGFEKYLGAASNKSDTLQSILGCAVKTGRIRLFMVPYFITYLIQFLLSLAGLVAVFFIVYGGFKYTTGGITEDKEAGKKTIMHALIGLVVSLSAWIIVNLIQVALTS